MQTSSWECPRFFEDTSAMFSILRETEAVIGGYFVLEFLLGSTGTSNNIDNPDVIIFAPFRTAGRVVRHLQEHEHYTDVNSFSTYGASPLVTSESCIDNPCDYIAGVRQVTRMERNGVSIEVIASGTGAPSDVATLPLACQWTTLLMCYIGVETCSAIHTMLITY